MPAMLERDRELASIESLVADLLDGRGRTLAVEGQPGLGKSTLLTAAPDDRAGLLTLHFTCGELERQLAWAGVIGLLSPAVAALAPARRRELFGGPAASAAALFGEASGDHAVVDHDRYGTLAAIERLVVELADRRPLLVVLDDVHWCDRPTLAWLAYLQRRLTRLPASLLLATRPPVTADQPQRSMLEGILAAPGVELRVLGPLGGASVELLVHERLPDAGPGFCERCREVTAGNPFFLHELLLELRARGADSGSIPDAGALAEVTPPAVLRSLLVRLERLAVTGAGEVATAAAVFGDGATVAHVAALAGLAEPLAADAVDALAAAGFLTAGEPLRFVHPLVRGAIDSEMPAARRARMHARAAEILASEHAPAEVVALHLLHAPRSAEPLTVARLRAGAARARIQGAPLAAARYLRRALEEPPAPADRVSILRELAHAETAFGDARAVVHLTEALALTEEPRERAELLDELGWVEHHAGRFPAAAAAFEAGLDLLDGESTGTDELADRLQAGYLVAATLDAERAATANERIRAIESSPEEIRGAAQRMLLAQVLFMRTMSGAPHTEIVELATRLWGDGRMLREEGPGSHGLWHVVGALSWADAYPLALRVIEQTLAAADAQGLVLAHAQGRYARAWPRLWMGEVRGAQEDAAAAIEIWDGGLETYLPAAVYWYGLASLELGEPERAESALGLTAPVARWQGTGMAGFIHALQGHLHLHHGRAVEALASHRACGEVMTSLMIASPSPMPWRSDAARVLRVLGELPEASRLAGEELALAQACGVPRAIGTARATLGMCTPGEPGIALLATAAAELARCDARLEQTRALVELGTALRRAGRRREARVPLHEALELAQRGGAVVLARRAQIELRAAGARGRTVPGGGPGSLTASERRVAELAAAGHSNRHIAGLLQVSIKAVEWHLHQSYRKLGIRGRSELAPILAGPG